MKIHLFASVVTSIIALIHSDSVVAQSGSRGSVPSLPSQPPLVAPQIPETQSLAAPVTSSSASSIDSPSLSAPIIASPNTVPAGQTPAANIPGLIDPVFAISDPSSIQSVDHSSWDYFLSRYLVTDKACLNRISYAKVTRNDRNLLTQYLCDLQSTDVRTLSLNEQLAFWFNLYNAKVVDLALRNYPIRSIRLIKKDLLDLMGPFDDPGAVAVLGVKLSLNDIESGIVRPLFQDPRIHYGLNCASYGCPNLARNAWTANGIDQQLDQAACRFVNSGRDVKKGLGGLRVSKIYKWYKEDFGDSDRAVIAHLRRYANRETRLMLRGKTTVSGYFYDWSLNDAKNSQPRLLEAIRL